MKQRKELQKLLTEKNLKKTSQRALIWGALLESRGHPSVEELRDRLSALPGIAEVYPSGGDFLLVRLDAPQAAGAGVRRSLLAEHAIEVKDVSSRIPGAFAHLRIAVRKPHDNQLLTDALRSSLPVVIDQLAAVASASGDRLTSR